VSARRHRAGAEDGFTLIEVMVAMVILVVGLLSVAGLLAKASTTTASTKAREQAVSLQRELVEAARGVPYAELVPTAVVDRLQANAGLADSTAGGGWNVKRRGVTYTLAVGVCSVDDAKDNQGPHDAGAFCANGAGTTTAQTCRNLLGSGGEISGAPGAGGAGAAAGDCGIDANLDGETDNLVNAAATACAGGCGNPEDSNPDDFKRVVTLVRWKTGTGLRYVLQSTTLPYPGLSGAPRVTSLVPSQPSPITDPALTSLGFTATTNRTAETLGWSVDGTPMGNAAGLRTTTFTFSWALKASSAGAVPNPGEVLDGDYSVGAKAFDAYGSYGPARIHTVKLNRRKAYAPQELQVVMVDDVVETEWAPNPERDIEGYRLFRRPLAGGTDTLVRQTDAADDTFARDSDSPPASGAWRYFVRALDKDPAGSTREGDLSALLDVSFDNRSPDPPTGVVATPGSGNMTLTWTAPAAPADPDAGDSIRGYRVYRDGQRLTDVYGPEVAVTSFVDSAPGDVPHTYWVVAVDAQGAQSQRVQAAVAP
jgi:prepilin-type N-terminal cleavage/methylation domain-containing protein